MPCLCLLAIVAAPPVWQIGRPDRTDAEFALAPGGYQEFAGDAFHVVGRSRPGADWPYVHPGPADGWAGSRTHTFSACFALQTAGGAGTLVLDLVDAHSTLPPRLAVELNDFHVELQPAAGAGDASVFGDPAAGRPQQLRVELPAGTLRQGLNRLNITTLSGSWVLYDALTLVAPGATTAEPPATIVGPAATAPAVRRTPDGPRQTIDFAVWHDGADATVELSAGGIRQAVELRGGRQTVSLALPPVTAATETTVRLSAGGQALAEETVTLRPVRHWELYVLAHSHVDIGYTHLQADVEAAQIRYLRQGIEAARATESYPEGSRFRWNAEVLWAVDSYLRQATEAQREEFSEAVQRGWIGLDALYGNELTALCRPEELVRLVRRATEIAADTGVPITSAMISDVPGYTWGLVPVLNAAGVRYFSVGPNGGDRIGYTLEAWQDKPFWWVGPDGRGRVLVWIPYKGYWRAFGRRQDIFDHVARLEASGYPYDLVQLRYCLGDNAGPGLELCDLVRDWNAEFEWPKLRIATTAEMFRAFEARYGDAIPSVQGDFTPYWEDGAASSALETGLNRAAAERLLQAEALFALQRPGDYPAAEFAAAWRDAILYDEHTWGAHNSISQPDDPFVLGQWRVKQAFATRAAAASEALLARAAGTGGEVANTCAWPRSDLVLLDDPAPGAQRTADGRYAVVARDVPALGSIRPVAGDTATGAWAVGGELRNEHLAVRIDERTGAIVSLVDRRTGREYADPAAGGLNAYRYVAGRDPAAATGPDDGLLTVVENGPVLATVRVESPAPGCRTLVREYSLAAGLPWLEVRNLVDKLPVREKEGVHFQFAFALPGAVDRIEVPFGVVRAEADQIAGACRNWYTAQRFVDVSNDEAGVTVATIDAPLVEVGGITAETPWLRQITPSATVCSYVMNNYWHTNYKADQEGPTQFRYRLRLHGPWNEAEAMRFGAEASQPLVPADGLDGPPLVRVTPAEVLVTALKPADTGPGWIVRLYGASDRAQTARLAWSVPVRLYRTDIGEQRGERVRGALEVPAHGLVMLRAEP